MAEFTRPSIDGYLFLTWLFADRLGRQASPAHAEENRAHSGSARADILAALLERFDGSDLQDNAELRLMENLKDLYENNGYMGGVANGMGLQQEHLVALDDLDREDEPDVDKDAALYVAAFSDEDDQAEAEVEDLLETNL